MREEKKELYKYISFFCAAAFCTSMFFVLGHFFRFYYDLNDDVLIKDILSGAYTGTPDAHNMQIMYPLSWILSILYSVNSQIPWFGLMELGLMWMCSVALIGRTQYIIMGHIGHKRWRIPAIAGMYMCIAVFATGTQLWELVIIQYTVVSGMLATTAVYLVFTEEDFQVNENIFSIILLVLSFNLRSEMFLLLCPFIAVVGFCKWLSEGFTREISKKFISFVLIVVALLGITVAVDAIAYRSTEWKEFKRVFDARTTLYDFTGIPDYESNKDFYEGNGAEKFVYDRLEDYNYVLSYKVTPVFLEGLADYALEHNVRHKSVPYALFEVLKGWVTWKTPAQRDTYTSLESAFYEEGIKINVPFNCIITILYLLAIIAAIYSREIKWAYMLPALILMRTVCWGYITYRGRINARIAHPLYFMECIILVGLLLVAWAESDYSSVKVRRHIAVLLTTAFICSNIINALYIPSNVKDINNKSRLREDYNVKAEALYDYTATNYRSYFLVDVYSTVNFTEQIFADNSAGKGNTQLAGGWMALSPLDEYKQSHFADEYMFITANKLDKLSEVDEIKSKDGNQTYFYVYKISDVKH